MNECEECGAVRPRWMGAHHECMFDPGHPYYDWVFPDTDEFWQNWIEDHQ